MYVSAARARYLMIASGRNKVLLVSLLTKEEMGKIERESGCARA
jgi:hypothetical protein